MLGEDVGPFLAGLGQAVGQHGPLPAQKRPLRLDSTAQEPQRSERQWSSHPW